MGEEWSLSLLFHSQLFWKCRTQNVCVCVCVCVHVHACVWTSDPSYFRASFSSRRVEIDDYNILFHIWDTAGQEKVCTWHVWKHPYLCDWSCSIHPYTCSGVRLRCNVVSAQCIVSGRQRGIVVCLCVFVCACVFLFVFALACTVCDVPNVVCI